MKRRRNVRRAFARRGLIVAACAATGLLAVSAAFVSAHRGQLNYNVTASKPVPDGAQVGDDISCAQGKVTGGGVFVTGSDVDLEVASSAPFDGNHAWIGYVNNDSGNSQTMKVTAICTKGDLRYPTKDVTIPSGDERSKNVSCPSGTSLVGGGVYVEGAGMSVEVAASGPFDDKDRHNIPDDGWTGAGRQATGSAQTLSVTAICAKSGSYEYVSKSRRVPANAVVGTDIRCPANTQSTGGGVNPNGQGDLEVATSAPYDGSDGDSVPDDAWAGYTNGGNVQSHMTTTIICRK